MANFASRVLAALREADAEGSAEPEQSPAPDPTAAPTVRRFVLHRKEDESGVSGTGFVAEGVRFSNGQVALCWKTDVQSISVFPDITGVEKIHGHGGKTAVVWVDQDEAATDEPPPAVDAADEPETALA